MLISLLRMASQRFRRSASRSAARRPRRTWPGSARRPRRAAAAAARRTPGPSRRPARSASRGRTACRSDGCGAPGSHWSAGQNRRRVGGEHLVGEHERRRRARRPNSSLVSARMMPRSRAISSARGVDRQREVAQPVAQRRRRWSRRPSSKVTFSSCSPSSALVAGVKIGSGSREPSSRPGGSGDAADRRRSRGTRRGPSRSGSRAPRTRPGTCRARAQTIARPAPRRRARRVGDHVVGRRCRRAGRTTTATSGEDPALVGDGGRQHAVVRRDPVARDEQQPPVGRPRTGRAPCRSTRGCSPRGGRTSGPGSAAVRHRSQPRPYRHAPRRCSG